MYHQPNRSKDASVTQTDTKACKKGARQGKGSQAEGRTAQNKTNHEEFMSGDM
jgi:hypothetical protein